MRLIIHDLTEEQTLSVIEKREGDRMLYAGGSFRNCVGCFGCWVRTPTECVIRDELPKMSSLLFGSDEVIIVSRMTYGWLSPECKCVLDRCIGYMQPFFTKVKGEMHHRQRSRHRIELVYMLYGDSREQERELAKKLAERNALNLGAEVKGVYVADTWQELGGVRL